MRCEKAAIDTRGSQGNVVHGGAGRGQRGGARGGCVQKSASCHLAVPDKTIHPWEFALAPKIRVLKRFRDDSGIYLRLPSPELGWVSGKVRIGSGHFAPKQLCCFLFYQARAERWVTSVMAPPCGSLREAGGSWPKNSVSGVRRPYNAQRPRHVRRYRKFRGSCCWSATWRSSTGHGCCKRCKRK